VVSVLEKGILMLVTSKQVTIIDPIKDKVVSKLYFVHLKNPDSLSLIEDPVLGSAPYAIVRHKQDDVAEDELGKLYGLCSVELYCHSRDEIFCSFR